MLNPRAAERFWAKVDRGADHECWLWQAAVVLGPRGGYGRFRIGGQGSKTRMAHVVAYEELVGPVPEGMQLDHLCRVRRCVNPGHLDPVPQRENWRRGNHHAAIVTRTNRCGRGHRLTAENVYLYRGLRDCRECRRNRKRASRQRRTAAA